MFKPDHTKIKIISFVLLNILLCAVFFIMPSIEEERHLYFGFYGIAEILLVYPSLSVIYGIILSFTYHKDYAFICMMTVTFFTCSIINTLIYDIAEPPAAFIYTGIMTLSVIIVRLACICLNLFKQSYRIYKEKSKNHSKEKM